MQLPKHIENSPTRPPHRHGVTTLEVALVLPVLLLLVFGGTDFGRVMHTSTALHNAVGAGATYAASHQFTQHTQEDWNTAVSAIVTEEMQSLKDFRPADFTLSVTSSTDASGNKVITITGGYVFQTVVNWPGLPRNVPIRSRLTVEQYR